MKISISKPEWEKPCWLHALTKIFSKTDIEIQKLAKAEGWDGKSEGLPTNKVISIAWELYGEKPDFSQTKEARNQTPKSYSGKTKLTGLVFTSSHVMPMIKGVVSNFNGYGDDPVAAVITFDKMK